MSPCKRICKMEKHAVGNPICIGCGRTRSEIHAWKIMSIPRRKLVLSVLQDRLRRVTNH